MQQRVLREEKHKLLRKNSDTKLKNKVQLQDAIQIQENMLLKKKKITTLLSHIVEARKVVIHQFSRSMDLESI
jgi:hypothetical protein